MLCIDLKKQPSSDISGANEVTKDARTCPYLYVGVPV